jgi:putative endonuclease
LSVASAQSISKCWSFPRKRESNFVSKLFCVYILTNKPRGTLYIGVTSNLPQRVAQHREKLVEGFTGKYGLARLVWFEVHENAESAIGREKQLKKWNRLWKIELVEKTNSDWHDVYDEIL